MRKRILAAILAIVTLTGCFTFLAGCNGDGIDKNRTQLYIGNFNGGMGYEWIEVIGAMFEEEYKDIPFEPGKKGVQIMIDNGKDKFTGEQIASSIAYERQDIYFTEAVSYEYLASQNLIADITDIITEKYDIVDLGEGEKAYSIEDKMQENHKNYYNYNGAYYALPYIAPIYGIMYDVDLFCAKELYFLANGTIRGSLNRPEDVLSNGPDGLPNTYDDGMPATWEDMKSLMKAMNGRGVTPFTWSGTHTYPRTSFFNTVWASYEGYEDYTLNYTFNGTMKDGTVITDDNAYILAAQYGRKAAAQAAYDIVSNKQNFSDNAFKQSQTHTGAQEEFLFSTTTDKPIAMILEGGYWENESKGVFSDMTELFGETYSRSNRRFSYMPIPKFIGTAGIPDQDNDKPVVNSSINSLCFIKANTTKLALAKEFMKYMHTNKILSKFNSVTGVVRNMKYTMSDDDYNAMSHYQKTISDVFKQANSRVTEQLVISDKIKQGGTKYSYFFTTTMIGNLYCQEAFKSYYDSIQEKGSASIKPEDWYQSYVSRYNASTW